MTKKRTNLLRLALIFSLAAISFLIYYDTLFNGFVYDDNSQIIRNPWIKNLSHLPDIFANHSFGFTGENQAISYRPMVFVVYMLEYGLFGLEPFGWHFVNIIFHALNSILVFLVVYLLIEGDLKEKRQEKTLLTAYLPPFIAALIFAAHPVNSESVSWVGCVPELFYTFLCLTAFYIHIKKMNGRRHRFFSGFGYYLVLGLLFFFALLFKETAIVLPMLLFIYDCLKERDTKLFDYGRMKRYFPYAVAVGVYAFARVSALGQITPKEKFHSYLSAFQFVINGYGLFIKDVKTLLLPFDDYPFQIFKPAFSISDIGGYTPLALTIVILLSFYLLRRRIQPQFFLAFSLMIFPILPTLYSPAVSRFPFADRYLYFPSIGFAFFLSLIFGKIIDYSLYRRKLAAGLGVICVFIVIIGLYSFGAEKRGHIWKDDLTLWSASVLGSPENYFARYNIGIAYLRENKMTEGAKEMERAINLNELSHHPDYSILTNTRLTLASVYAQMNDAGRAISEYNKVISIEPDNFNAYYNLASLYQGIEQLNDALETYQKALIFAKRPSQIKDTYNNIGNCYVRKSRWEDAADSFAEALKYQPNDPVILQNFRIMRQTEERCNFYMDRKEDAPD